MATNYKVHEVVEILAKGEDGEAILDIGRRFPLLAIHTARCVALAGEDFIKFVNAMPEYVTALKANNGFKAEMLGASEEEPKKAAKPKAEPKKRAAKKEEPVEEEEAEEVEEEEAEGYAAMNAMELFKECKKRKIKAQPKKTAKYYIGLLEKDDAAKAKAAEAEEEVEEDEDDDWDI